MTGARLVSSVRDRYGEAGAFTAPRRFVAVHYKLRNLGPAVVEPAAHVNRQFGLTGTTSGIVLSVDRVNGCGAAPSSYARRVGRDNPEEGQKPGQKSETVALYAIAGSTKRMAWTAPGLHVKVHLGDVDASARGAARPPARGEIHGR